MVTSSFSLCDTLISRLQLAFPISPSPLRGSSQFASAGNASYGSDFNEIFKYTKIKKTISIGGYLL